MTPTTARRLTAAIALLAAAAMTAWAATYTLELTRRTPVGTKYRVAATGTLERRGTRQVADRRTNLPVEQLAVTLEAVATVAAVDDRGRDTEVRYAVARCTARRERGGELVVVQPGKTVIARRAEGRVDYAIDGEGPIDDASVQALGLVIRLPVTDTTFDQTFGPGKAVGVGDTWPIRTEAYRGELSAAGLGASEAKVDGVVKLADVRTDASGEVYDVQTTVRVSGMTQPSDLADGRTSDVAMTATITLIAPADPRRPILREVSRVELAHRITGEGADGQHTAIHGQVVRTLTLTRTPLD